MFNWQTKHNVTEKSFPWAVCSVKEPNPNFTQRQMFNVG